MKKDNFLTIVVPCFNEEEVLPETVKELGGVLVSMIDDGKIDPQSKILFVDDGSKDKTWKLIQKFEKEHDYITGIKFSKNFGHQNALIAGMTTAVEYSDMIVTIDADLQDDIYAIPKMVDKYHNGYDVVYGVRNNRDTDTPFKRKTAMMFYGLMQKLGVNMVPNSADFRLMSKRATVNLLNFKEENLFLRGMVPLVGFPSTKVYYARKERFAGESKYPLKKMLKFAADGITSFSTTPIRLIMLLGFIIVGISIVLVLYSIIRKLTGHTIVGWSSLMISIWLLGGIQLICISVIGEYIGKIFTEVKHRPRFIIEEDDYTPVVRNEEK
ncbi:glycosyltransferase family 2 protein [Ligilactobacillus sp. LYQ135]